MCRAEDLSGPIRKTVEKSTLDQPGTKPFHLKAAYAPSFERDKASNRVGEVEIWWQSPSKWRREVSAPGFHQVAIVNGDRQWQKNDGDYFPEWLRELAVAIVRPVPLPTDVLVKRLKTGDVRRMARQINVNWDAATEFDNEQANASGGIATNENADLLFYSNGANWGGQYKDFHEFHGRNIAHTVSAGYLEVTAKISVLENLGDTPPGFFDTNAPGGDAQPIDTVLLSVEELGKVTLPAAPIVWPPVENGPFEGVVWTRVVLDRTGKVRDMISPIADNPGMAEAANAGFRAMQFQPVLRNGIPVQATGIIRVQFKTTRPAGMETFDSAKNYFELGRKASFLAAGATAPYSLHAEFQVGTKDGLQTGRYEDTWISATEWRREVWFGPSHLVKTQSGDNRYVLAEGTQSGMLRLVMQLIEPLPAEDTMTESDWRIRRETLGGLKTVRVFRGSEGPNGELEPGKSQGFWFDEGGRLVKSYTNGFELRPSAAQEYGGVLVARQIDVLKDGQVVMRINVKDVGVPDASIAKGFELKGHEWQRAFTSEVR